MSNSKTLNVRPSSLDLSIEAHKKRLYDSVVENIKDSVACAIAMCAEIPMENEKKMHFVDVEIRLREIFSSIPNYVEVEEAGLSEWFFGDSRMKRADKTMESVHKLSDFANRCLGAFVAHEAGESDNFEIPPDFIEDNMPSMMRHGPRILNRTIQTTGIKLAITARLFLKVSGWFDKFLCIVLMYLDFTGFQIALQDLTEALRLLFLKTWNSTHNDNDEFPYTTTSEPTGNQVPNRETNFVPTEECGATEIVSAIIMIGGFLVYGKMPDKSDSAKLMTSLSAKFHNIGKISSGVHGGLKLYQTLVSGINESVNGFIDLLCPEQNALRILDDNKLRITKWMDDVSKLDREDTFIRLTCDPALHRQINMLRDQADEYSRIYQSLDYRPLNITALFMKSLNAIIRISNKASHISLNVGSRLDPFCIYLYGEPGVGKSFLSTELVHEVADTFNIPKFRRIYPRAMDEKFWSDYSQQFAVVIDDFGQLRDPVSFDPYAEFIIIKSNVPKTVQMADVNEKGRQFLSQMIAVSSNIAYPNPNSIETKEALWRRRDCLIEVVRKDIVDIQTITIGDTDHLRFRMLDPIRAGVPLTDFMTYSALKKLVIEKATVHLKRQKDVAIFLNRRDMEPVIECGLSHISEDGENFFDFRNVRKVVGDYLAGKIRAFSTDQSFVKVTKMGQQWYSTRGRNSSNSPDYLLIGDFLNDLSTSIARQYAALNSPCGWNSADYPPAFLGFDSFGILNLVPWWIMTNNSNIINVERLVEVLRSKKLIIAYANYVFRTCNPFDKGFDDILPDISNLFRYDMNDGYFLTSAFIDMRMSWLVWCDTNRNPDFGDGNVANNYVHRERNFIGNVAVNECGLEDSDLPPEDGIDIPPCCSKEGEAGPYSGFNFDHSGLETIDRCVGFQCIKDCAVEFAQMQELNASWGVYLKMLIDNHSTLGGAPICLRCRDVMFEEHDSMIVETYESVLSKLRRNIGSFMNDHPRITKVLVVTGAVVSAIAVYKLWASFTDEEEEVHEHDCYYDDEFSCESVRIEEALRGDPDGIKFIARQCDKYRSLKEKVFVKPKGATTVVETGKEYYRGETKRLARKPTARIVVTETGGDPNAEQIIDHRIMPSMVRFERLVELNGSLVRVYSQNAFQIVGKLFLVNAHALVKFNDGDYVRIRPRSGIEFVIAFDKADCAFGKEGDVAIYNAGASVPSGKDNTNLICTEDDLQYLNNFPASVIQIDKDLRNYYYHADLKAHDVNKSVPYLDQSKIILRKIWTARINVEQGECGGTCVALVPRCPRKIVGIVSATFSNRPQGLFQIVTQELLRPLLKQFPQQIVDDGLDSKREMLKLSYSEAEECGLDLGNIDVLDQYKIRRVGSARGTQIRASPLFDIFPHQTEPSVLSKNDPRMEVPIDPLVNGIRKYGTYHKPLPPRQLEEAYQSLEQEMLGYEPLRPYPGALTIEQAVNGMPIEHYDRIDMKSSPGIPYVYSRPPNESGKAYLFDIDGEGYAKVKSNLLLNEIESRLKSYKCGKRYPSIWTNCLKDERRSLEKIRTGNTRTFMMAPVDFTIITRMYFLDFCASMIKNRIHSFHSVGINADSSEWSLLFMELERISELGFDGDYGNYDGFLFAKMIELFGRAVNAWYNDGPEAALVRRVILDEVIHTYSAFLCKVIQKNHGMPSGVALTALLNSFCNALLMRTGYLCLTKKAVINKTASRADNCMQSYRKNVKENVFGDDHINAVVERVLRWFNQNTYSDWLAEFGIRYTDADKTLVNPPPFKKILECKYLKRGFVRDERFPTRIRAPIEMKTIQELINWVTDTLDPMEQLELNYIDALRFLFHYGEKVFNSFRMVVDSGFKDIGLLPPAINYAYFEEEFDDTFV